MVEVVTGDDPVNAVDRSDSPSANVVDRLDSSPANVVGRPDSPPPNVIDRPDSPPTAIPLVDLSWVDPKVVEFSSTYDTEKSVATFLAKYPVLKAGEDSDDSRDPDYFRILPCGSTERVCMDRAGVGPPFFYMYTCFFSDLHVSLPFDKFTMDVLRALNVAPTQVHPNTWASLQAFRLLCDTMRLRPTPSSFLSYYGSHLGRLASWLSLAGRPGYFLFDPFVVSYKRFKERFVKVVIRPEATTFFFDRSGRSRFPLYWTSKPKDFKFWPRPTESEEEVEILSFFDTHPRKLPCRSLIGAYTETARWATIRDMGSSFVVSVGIFLFVF